MKKNSNNITELVIIIDKSGSMHGLEEDTIGGVNAFLDEQKKIDGQCFVTTILFDEKSHTLIDREDLREVKALTEKDYKAGGCTALVDSVADAIKHIETIHKYVRKEDVPENTIFFVTTDGLENASHKYSSAELKKMIERKKEEKWEFVFAAANIDAVETAKTYGIDEDKSINYVHDKKGTGVMYSCVSECVSNKRMKKTSNAWKERAEKHFESNNNA